MFSVAQHGGAVSTVMRGGNGFNCQGAQGAVRWLMPLVAVFALLAAQGVASEAKAQAEANTDVSSRTIELRSRAELTLETEISYLEAIIRGRLYDDRGVGLAERNLDLAIADNQGAELLKETVNTDSSGNFELEHTFESEGEYTLSVTFDGDRFIDSASSAQEFEISRQQSDWRYKEALLIPLVGQGAVQPGEAVTVLARPLMDGRQLKVSGSCIERALFREAGPEERQERNASRMLPILRTEESFEESCEVVFQAGETDIWRASQGTTTLVPVRSTITASVKEASRIWSRTPASDFHLHAESMEDWPPSLEFALVGVESQTEADDAGRIVQSSTLGEELHRPIFSDVQSIAAGIAQFRVVHRDVSGQALWKSELLSVPRASRMDELRSYLLPILLIFVSLVMLYVLYQLFVQLVQSRTEDEAKPGAVKAHSNRLPVKAELGDWRNRVEVRDQHGGWALREAFLYDPESGERWLVDEASAGSIQVPQEQLGRTLIAGAPGYFEDEITLATSTDEILLRPAREYIRSRVYSVFEHAGVDTVGDLPDWGTRPPRDILLEAIRERFPLWQDGDGLADVERPLAFLSAEFDSDTDIARRSRPDQLALAALMLEVAWLAPSIPAQLTDWLDALEDAVQREGQ